MALWHHCLQAFLPPQSHRGGRRPACRRLRDLGGVKLVPSASNFRDLVDDLPSVVGQPLRERDSLLSHAGLGVKGVLRDELLGVT